MRIGILLFHVGFMNELFFSFVQIIQPHMIQDDYKEFHQSNITAAYLIIFSVPILMAFIIYHFYKSYNSDVLEHYYTLRESSLYLLIYSQALILCLGVGKPVSGFFLILL